jgi:hypothetical protein
MPLSRKLDYVILDLIESAARTVKTAPLNLGGYGGAAGGIGSPPGGYIGWLPQTNVAYDEDEFATLDTAPSGFSAPSGWSLLDNLNHIRYRLQYLETSGVASSGILVDEYDGSPSVSSTTWITFSGGAEVSQLAPGHALVNIIASGGGASALDDLTDVIITSPQDGDILIYSGLINQWVNIQPLADAPFDGEIYGRQDGTWVLISGITGSGISGINIEEDSILEGTEITSLNFTGDGVDVSVLGNEATITISGISGSEEVLHIYNEDLTPDADSNTFITSFIYESGTLRVYYNGLRQRKSVHYLDDVDFVTFSTYFTVPSGESLIVDYDYLASSQASQESLMDSVGFLILDSLGEQLTESL